MITGKTRLNFIVVMSGITGKIWRVIDLLKWSKDYLAGKGVESPQIETEWMLRHVLDCSRLEIYMQHERPLTEKELAEFKVLLKKRIRGIPIQYVLGYTDFMGYSFEVNPSVLIPRPETERLVEKAGELLKASKETSPHILDVGTGSGCIAVSLAAECPHCRVTALDNSPEALQTAARNARAHGVSGRIQLIEMDILKEAPAGAPFFLIVSNPPYVAGEYWERLPDLVKNNEPRQALYPGEDELVFYRRLAGLAQELLPEGGYLLTEIGGGYQEDAVCRVFRENSLDIREVVQDYSGESRVVVAGRAA